MADRIKGITIEIGGDTTKLSTAMKNADKEIKNTQKELRDVENLLKLDPTNTELLAQKQKLLAQNVQEVSSKLETLKEAEKQAQEQFAKGEISQAQYDGLKREIVATEEALKKAKAQASEFESALNKVGDVAKKVSNNAGAISEKTKGLSAAAGGVVAGLGGMALNAVALSDDLNTLSKQSGLTTEEIQQFRYASDVVDVSTDSIISAVSKIRKNMNSTSKDVQSAWERIGVSVTDADGNFRDSTEVFYETLEGLSQIENETERDIVAMSLFGKSADQLAGIIDDGGEALKTLGQQAKDSGVILSQDALDSLNAVGDQIDILKANITGTLAVTGAKAMETLQPTFELIIEKVSTVLEWIGSLDSDTLNLVITIGAVVASISPLAGIISNIGTAISGVTSFLPKIIEFATANPILLIAAAVGTLAALIYKNWDKIKPILEAIKEKVKDVFNTIVEWGKSKINALLTIFNKFIAGINVLIGGINKIQFDTPDWIPVIGGKHFGFNIPYLNELPMLANGGVVGNGGSAIVGERGAEILTNVGGNAVVTPLTANVDTSAITNAIRQGQGKQTISISFEGSLSQLGRVLQPVIKSETSRIGGSLINV